MQGWAPRSFAFRTHRSFAFFFLCFWRVMKPKRTMHSFKFFSKEGREWNVLLKRMKERKMKRNERFVHFSNVLFDFWVYETTFDPKKGQKNSKNERNVRKMNETFFLQTKKERRERNILFKRTEKNVKNELFFYKERKRTWEQNISLKRTDAQPWSLS